MSEFGSGVVVCLAKFSEHMSPFWREKFALRAGLEDSDSDEKQLSLGIALWMNGASDHFYELDREAAPAVLCELADFALEIGHGFTDRTWTEEDVERLIELWQQSCLAVDALLGVEADWGEW